MAGKVLNISLNATITPLQKALENVGKMMNDFAASIEKTDKKMADSIRANVADMNASLEKVKQSFVNTEKAGDSAGKKGTASLRQQLRQATQEAQRLAESVGTSDPKFIAAAKRAAELKDSIDDTALAINAMNPDEKFKGLATVMSGALNVAAGLQGAMNLFGLESENATKAMAKLQALLAMAQGINALGGLKDAMGAVKTQVISAAQSMGAFKTALIATGIGAAIVLIGVLAANWDKVSDAILGTSDKTRAYKMAQEEVNKSVSEAQAKFYEANNAIDLYKQGVLSKDEALKIYNETAGESLGKTNDIIEADNNLKNGVPTYLQMMEHKIRAQVLYAKAAEESAKIASGEAADPGFWQSLGNMLLSSGDAFQYYAKQGQTMGKNITDSQKKVNDLVKIANDEMKQSLENEKKMGDVKAKNAKYDEKHKTTAKSVKDDSANQRAKMLAENLQSANEAAGKEIELSTKTGLSILQIDQQFEAMRLANKFMTNEQIYAEIERLADAEKKAVQDKIKMDEDAAMEKAKRLQENLSMAEEAGNKEIELSKKTGLTMLQIDQQFEAIRKANTKLTNDEIYDLIEKGSQKAIKSIDMSKQAAEALNKALQDAASQGIAILAESLGTALAGGAITFADVLNSLVSMVADTAMQLGKQFIAMGVASLAVQLGLFEGPAGAAQAIAAGAALVAAGAAAKQIIKNMGAKKMEQGGLVYGNSFVNVGEYGNAHTNPEVIAPLSKLKDMIGGNNSQRVMVEGRLYGSQLALASNRSTSIIKRVTGKR